MVAGTGGTALVAASQLARAVFTALKAAPVPVAAPATARAEISVPSLAAYTSQLPAPFFT